MAAEMRTGSGGSVGGVSEFVDRWIYVFMAALFTATVLGEFIPTSLALLKEIDAGHRPPSPPVLHIHAVLMGFG